MTKEEAIEVYNGLINEKIKEAFEVFAPELKKDEDERMRKEIAEFVKSRGGFKGEWIEWLEKQKELHLGYPGLYFYDGEKLHFQGNPAMEEKQKEQKPIDTRDTDDLQLLGFIYDLLDSLEWRKEWAMGKEECLQRLSDYSPKKPEWSEEDVHNSGKPVYQWNMADFEKEIDRYWDVMNIDKFMELRKFKPIARYFLGIGSASCSIPHAPLEWSEKDEDMYSKAHRVFAVQSGERLAYKQKDFEELDAWLKSLKNRGNFHSWKPSEEQMEALLWYTAHLGGADHRILAELYEHLKKLM